MSSLRVQISAKSEPVWNENMGTRSEKRERKREEMNKNCKAFIRSLW